MSNHLTRFTFHPLEGAAAPVGYLGGTDRDIPIVSFGGLDDGSSQVVGVHLGNHPDPAGYLRECAENMLALAYLIDTQDGAKA